VKEFDSDNPAAWPLYLSLVQVGRIFNMSRRSAWDMTEFHGLPYANMGNGTKRERRMVHRDDVLAELTKRRTIKERAKDEVKKAKRQSRKAAAAPARTGGFYDLFYGVSNEGTG
jgi:hypothetical protein